MTNSSLRTTLKVLDIGWVFAASMAVGVWGGRKIGIWLELEPWGTIIGSLLGITAGFSNLYRVAVQFDQKKSDEAGK